MSKICLTVALMLGAETGLGGGQRLIKRLIKL
jgi:hypothetical protein